jgi:glycosyltransferase 2 family protein
MKKAVTGILKVSIPLALGIFLIWFIYKDLSLQDKEHILQSFKTAEYRWIFLSMILGVFSHISRAYRWNILLKPLGHTASLKNNFFAIMVGYLANMAFPRLGEISRAAVVTKYEKIPFEKGFGTIMAERVVDMIILFVLTLITIASQMELLGGFLKKELLMPLKEKFSADQTAKVIFVGILLVFAIGTYYILKTKIKILWKKLKSFLLGFAEGFKTILKIEKKGMFLFHSLFIWLLYFLMLWVCFYSLPETANVSLGGVLSCFIFGSFGIIAVQGGIGAYPAILTKTLALYGIATPFAFALGWIAWTGQTLMILLTGLLSIILLPLTNKKTEGNEQHSDYKVKNISA